MALTPEAIKRVERRQDRHHAGFIIRGRARVKTPLRIDRLVCFGRSAEVCRPIRAAALRSTGCHGNVPLHLSRIRRLAIVVCVKDERASGARSFPFTIDDRRRGWIGGFEQSRRSLRRCIMVMMAAALRRMFSRSLATFGIASSSMNSLRISCS